MHNTQGFPPDSYFVYRNSPLAFDFPELGGRESCDAAELGTEICHACVVHTLHRLLAPATRWRCSSLELDYSKDLFRLH